VVHRASGKTHPNGLGAPQKAAHQGRVARGVNLPSNVLP
jgi:hypothetical protein